MRMLVAVLGVAALGAAQEHHSSRPTRQKRPMIETAGKLALDRRVPKAEASICASACKLPTVACKSENFESMLQYIGRNGNVTKAHMLGAWSATVWSPRESLPFVVSKWQATQRMIYASVVHGLIWRAMLDAQEVGEAVDAGGAWSQLLRGVIGYDGKTTQAYMSVVAHGIGHGAMFAALKVKNVSSTSCATLALPASSGTIRTAERVCAAAPSVAFEYVCASGVHMSHKLVPTTKLPTNVADLARSSVLNTCERVKYPSFCLYHRFRHALENPDFSRRFKELVFDNHRSVEDLCPSSRWTSPLARRSCFFGVTAAVYRDASLLARLIHNKTKIPMSFEWCRPRIVEDNETAMTTAACVSGAMWTPTVHLADRVYASLADPDHHAAVTASCREACASLANDTDSTMRFASRSCAMHLPCLDFHQWIGRPLASSGQDFVVAALLEEPAIVSS